MLLWAEEDEEEFWRCEFLRFIPLSNLERFASPPTLPQPESRVQFTYNLVNWTLQGFNSSRQNCSNGNEVFCDSWQTRLPPSNCQVHPPYKVRFHHFPHRPKRASITPQGWVTHAWTFTSYLQSSWDTQDIEETMGRLFLCLSYLKTSLMITVPAKQFSQHAKPTSSHRAPQILSYRSDLVKVKTS